MFLNPADYPFTANLEANFAAIRKELLAIPKKDFMAWPERFLYGNGWDVFGLYAFGQKMPKNCALCPVTTRAVEAIPGLTTAGFSWLEPGTHIKPHKGYSKAVLRCHLALIIPEECRLRVGDDTRSWEEGTTLVFDDTTEHEAWNHSQSDRVVLLLDFKRSEPGAEVFQPLDWVKNIAQKQERSI
jgi:aspartyl/asparaginyl beta-hydroxylase (cupin superfamily)